MSRRNRIACLILLCAAAAFSHAYADEIIQKPALTITMPVAVPLTAAWNADVTARKYCEIEKSSVLASYKISTVPIPTGTTVTRANLYSSNDWGKTFSGALNSTQDRYYESITCGAKLLAEPWFLCDHTDNMSAQDSQGAGIYFHRVAWQELVWVAGTVYKHAIGMHPGVSGSDVGGSWAEFKIPPGAKYFSTSFGMARQDTDPTSYGVVGGSILINGKQVWSGTLSGSMKLDVSPILLPQEATVVRLVVDSQGTRWADHATWLDPRFTSQP